MTPAVFTFGALAFSILTGFYWGERRRRGRGRRSGVFPWFTLVCAAAFLSSLLLEVVSSATAAAGLILVRDLTSGLLPPLILHLISEVTCRPLPRWTLASFYAVSGGCMLVRGLNETGLWSTVVGDALFQAPAALLAAAAAAGLVVEARALAQRAYRRWIRGLLALMLVSACASLAGYGLAALAPDYLVLALFCVSLYYRERLVFFDVLVKRGAFLAIGLAIMAAGFVTGSRALLLLACWLAGPWVYAQVARAVDRVWLRRPYSAAEAERQFLRDLQAAATEDDLRARATASLGTIFQATADVRFDASPAGAGDDGLAAAVEPHGGIVLAARPNGVPFLSDDRRLLQSLAAALGVMLENVRFREREEQLRLLASRAELKALRAQINPHFLFNTLSVIAGLTHYQPELADDTIERLAAVFRYTLRKSEAEWATVAEEVEFVTAYLRIEQARFGDRLHVEVDVAPAAAQVTIPAMSVQPLVENAIKHGVSAMEGGGLVGLRAAIRGNALEIEVSDNGPGFPPGFTLEGPGEAHGLRNVAERMRGYFGDGARLGWESGAGGTRVTLTIDARRRLRCAS